MCPSYDHLVNQLSSLACHLPVVSPSDLKILLWLGHLQSQSATWRPWVNLTTFSALDQVCFVTPNPTLNALYRFVWAPLGCVVLDSGFAVMKALEKLFL